MSYRLHLTLDDESGTAAISDVLPDVKTLEQAKEMAATIADAIDGGTVITFVSEGDVVIVPTHRITYGLISNEGLQ